MVSLRALKLDLDAGLDRLSVPMRRGYMQGTVGVTTLAGPVARFEGGVLLLPGLAAFAFGTWQPNESSAGGGIRWTF